MINLTNLPGQILDNQYKIEKLLGQGGMGAVYKAYHVKLGDVVAIKIMPPNISSNPENQKRFFREGQAARRFKHPNAVLVHDLRDTADGTLYMVLEYVEGNNLRNIIDEKKYFSAKEALQIIEPVANALNEAHKLGVVHRDVKPENIMVSYKDSNEPLVKLLDLGIAKIKGTTSLTVEGQVLGTPYYMSPEQWGIFSETEAVEKDLEVDGRADIYSLGVILYEMATGQRPFVGATIQELAVKHITSTPLPAKKINPDLPEGFSQIIAKAISKERINRPVSCQELITQLHNSLKELANKSSHTLPMSEMTDALVKKDNFDTIALRKHFALSDKSKEQDIEQLADEQPTNPSLFNTKPNPILDGGREAGLFNKVETEGKKGKLVSAYLIYSLVGFIAFTVIVVVLVFYKLQQPNLQKPVQGIKNFTQIKNENAGNPSTTVFEKQEILRYWVEVVTQEGKMSHEVKDIFINSGDTFQFHIESKVSGYLYILMPGKRNQLSTILTSKPISSTGVKDNLVKLGAEYKFPNGADWLTIGKIDRSNKFILIFSLKTIESVPFLNKTAGYSLSDEDKEDLTILRQQTINTELEVIEADKPYALVKVNKALAENDYLVFEIDIKLK